jgi:PDZ domain-containing secreted protein
VGGIGALAQKAVAVRESGVTLFLVPSEQSDEEIAQAQKAAGTSVKIVAVSDLDEALDALRQNGGELLGSVKK